MVVGSLLRIGKCTQFIKYVSIFKILHRVRDDKVWINVQTVRLESIKFSMKLFKIGAKYKVLAVLR